MKFISSLVLSIVMLHGLAFGQTDSATISFDAFMEIVKANHPISKQADLLIESGEANLRKAKGSFDPIIKSTYDKKQFDGKNYYQLNSNELKFPTALGLEIKAGYDNNQGVFVNPENQLPENGLAYAGIAVPLGKGLLFDERRQAVRQAEVFERSSELERVIMRNQLIFEASKVYWEWYSAWNAYEIFDESVRLAEFRLNGVKQSFKFGEVPAIDTLEAFIIVQNRQLSRNDALIKMRKVSLEVSNYLWSADLQPMVLIDTSKPELHDYMSLEKPLDESSMTAAIAGLDQSHPKLLLYFNKLENLNFERRSKAEMVKPKINFNYNLLSQPVGGNPIENYSTNDYKWGFEFSMPLLLRKGRGDLQLTKIKINQTDLDRQLEMFSIKNKIKSFQVEILNLFEQMALYRNAVDNYEKLLDGEKRKFEEGESSLFLVNSRENSFITSRVKLIDLMAKYQKAQAGLILAIGGEERVI